MLTFEQIQSLHQLYNELVGTMAVPWTMQRLWAWEQWGLQFTPEDLKLVVAFIKRKQAAKRPCRSLNFRSLISGPNSLDWFAEDLSEARTELLIQSNIKQQKSPRNKALLATGRSMPEVHKVRTPAQILAGEQALRDLLKARDNL